MKFNLDEETGKLLGIDNVFEWKSVDAFEDPNNRYLMIKAEDILKELNLESNEIVIVSQKDAVKDPYYKSWYKQEFRVYALESRKCIYKLVRHRVLISTDIRDASVMDWQILTRDEYKFSDAVRILEVRGGERERVMIVDLLEYRATKFDDQDYSGRDMYYELLRKAAIKYKLSDSGSVQEYNDYEEVDEG